MITTMTNPSDTPSPVNTINTGVITTGQNLPNHSLSMAGRGKFVGSGAHEPPRWRTRQEAYRFCAWALLLVDIHDLPDEEGAHTFEQIQEAITTEISGE